MAVGSHLHNSSARQRATRRDTVRTLGRAGFIARGIVYLLIGWIALLIALKHNALQADRSGALELIAGEPFGEVLLWFLAVGFAGMALWRLSLAVRPTRRDARKTSKRAASAARAVFYAAACASTLTFILQHRVTGSSDQTSQDFTARAMAHRGGAALVALVAVALIGGGLALVWRGLTRAFAKNLQLGSMSAAKRRWVLRLGTVGNCARGVVFAAAGGFMLDAAVSYDPARAKGIDATLRSFAAASYGPVLLVLTALGLAAFGVYSWGEARWRRL
ncbi:MAG TPA: DUF1206 domain-containing protein [Actinocrinis sp.]|nr:DUF1206 domain-containing protein [Actinocrinis sp.]